MVSVDDLLHVAETSTREVTVLEPRDGDANEKQITYIDANSFVSALELLKRIW